MKTSETLIKSRDNALARHARAVRDGKINELIFIEGVRLAEEALRASLIIQDVLCTQKFCEDERGKKLLSELEQTTSRLALVSDAVLDSIADTKTPQGIVALAERPHSGRAALEEALGENPLLVIMHRISNPANAGAVLRTAEAAGACGAITTANSTNIFSPRALRGAMGSSFRLPLWTGASFQEIVDWCNARGIRTFCADAKAVRAHTEIDWRIPCALIVGTEGEGLSLEEVAAADETVSIPMRPPVESLNLAVASAVLLYEAARQRGKWANE